MSSAEWRPFCPGLNVLRLKDLKTDIIYKYINLHNIKVDANRVRHSRYNNIM